MCGGEKSGLSLVLELSRCRDFVKEIAAAAERYNHHPDIEIYYDEVVIMTCSRRRSD